MSQEIATKRRAALKNIIIARVLRGNNIMYMHHEWHAIHAFTYKQQNTDIHALQAHQRALHAHKYLLQTH